MTDPADNDDLLRRASSGDQEALAPVFSGYRDRLRQMVRPGTKWRGNFVVRRPNK
jgi:hypothetical protein